MGIGLSDVDKFPLGFGKIESLGSLGVSSLLLVGGILMAYSSVADLAHLYAPAVADSLEYIGLMGHSHGHSHQIPNMGAAWLAGGSVVIKEWLYRASKWTPMCRGRRLWSKSEEKAVLAILRDSEMSMLKPLA